MPGDLQFRRQRARGGMDQRQQHDAGARLRNVCHAFYEEEFMTEAGVPDQVRRLSSVCAASADEAGFWPVIRRPSVTT